MLRMACLSFFPFFVFLPAQAAAPFQAGAAAVDITPRNFESRPLNPDDPLYYTGQDFFDSGTDGLFDYEEPGALGPDLQPGIAGLDDDGDGVIDNCDRYRCAEYLASGSDDVADPNDDNYSFWKLRWSETEDDGVFQGLHLGGFSPWVPFIQGNRLAIGIHDPIWARALAFQGSNGRRTVLITTDLPGLVWKHINPVRRKIEKKFGIPTGDVIITSTHNHAGPDAAGYWSTILPGHEKKYTDRLRRWLFEAAERAILAMEPAELRTITTTHFSCIDRRTGKFKRDPDCEINPNIAAETSQTYDEPLIQSDFRDPTVRNTDIVATQARSLATGKTIGTFVNWHNHPDGLGDKNMEISSDFPHYIRDYVENELGGIAAYFSGTVGCQTSNLRNVPAPLWNIKRQRVLDPLGNPVLVREGWDQVRSIGYEIGFEAVQALRATSWKRNVNLTILTEEVKVHIDNPLHLVATGSVWLHDVEGPDKMVTSGQCWSWWGCVRSDVSVLQMGDLTLVTGPGEIDPAYFHGRRATTADYGAEWGKWFFPRMPGWKKWMRGPHKAVLGQANNYLSYLVPRSDNHGWWNREHPNNYEEFVTTGYEFGDQIGNKLHEMLGSAERIPGRPRPSGEPEPWSVKKFLNGMKKK